MMPDKPVETDAGDLIARMNSIRNLSEFHVAELHDEAQRLVDWREHVRAQPLLAVGAATVAGFVLAQRSTSFAKPPRATSSADTAPSATTAAAGAAMGLTALLGSVAASAVRAYATKIVNNMIEGTRHEHRDSTQEPYKR